ncbi:glycosyl transferase family group 2-domain-containing protein [Vararia minispora EC-137]|uniref:Glycosyl transferase family group 2-domain-containing protein n=1 Tax=Vararia minispora EC-137 TaxID=1314806 RepID=A0ACB8QQ24_9AGAM|nr:glycosyl transferase family group 2-domain-containing protein [Vararia minispora EC-137]
MDYDAYDALLHHIFKQTQGEAWFKPSAENVHVGVCLRISTSHFRVFPYENHYLEAFELAVRSLNPLVAVKIRSAAVHVALGNVAEKADAIYVDDDTRIQILDTMYDLPRADKEQCGAFIRDERVLVVWSDNLETIIPLCHDFDSKLIGLVWNLRVAPTAIPTAGSVSPTAPNSAIPSAGATPIASSSDVQLHTALAAPPESSSKETVPGPAKSAKKSGSLWGWRIGEKASAASDAETGSGVNKRPMRMFAPIYGGLGAALSIFFIGSGLSTLLQEWRLDHDYTRFALMVTAPFLFCVSLVLPITFRAPWCLILSSSLGPVAQYHENSKYYSAVKPAPNKDVDSRLPHVTIELPVYKESLKETITPSVVSIKKAMQTYARQGGTSSIFVHDDGLQLISEADRNQRIAFYANHGIGWVARPKHDESEGGFKRRGRFKKASNMNYGLALSLKMEEHIRRLELERGEKPTDDDEQDGLEEKALGLAIEETYEESGKRFRPWAHNAKALRVGEIILIIDADTIVPEDCFRDAARELAECPEVAIIQHESDVMQVAHHYFENGIAHFTRRINKCISMGCANGEVAPFVGHNAFLRWSAIQEAAFEDPEDGNKKKAHMLKNYIIRWATYSDGGFKEGVSLTADDELNRWQKYSYGCNELIFHPLKDWWRYGPITKQLRTFLWTDAPVHYKLSMMSYMFSYYGLAAAFTLSVLNYVLLGFSFSVDGFYLHSFEIWLACTVVFPGAGNLGFTLLEYRLGLRSLWSSFVENITWIPFFFFFFGGLPIHLSTALLSHLFSYNMTWAATKKEVERSNFFIEVPRVLRRFWFAFALSFAACIAMIILSTGIVPEGWQVPGVDWAVILPLAITAGSHILFPIVLNPYLMVFSF